MESDDNVGKDNPSRRSVLDSSGNVGMLTGIRRTVVFEKKLEPDCIKEDLFGHDAESGALYLSPYALSNEFDWIMILRWKEYQGTS